MEKWHIVKPGTAEQRKMEYWNTKSETIKPGYGIPNPGQTVSSAKSHANKSRLVDSSVSINFLMCKSFKDYLNSVFLASHLLILKMYFHKIYKVLQIILLVFRFDLILDCLHFLDSLY